MKNGAIYSKRCWIDGGLSEATIVYEDGIITKVIDGRDLSGENFIDAGDEILMPGVIDAHVHVNEPGRTHWEGFHTATMAAAAGGITTIVDMPLNADPVTTSVTAFEKKLKATTNKLHVNCGFYGGLVPGNFHELQKLIDAGVLGIKAFLAHSGINEFPNCGEAELDDALALMKEHALPLLVHCEITAGDHGKALVTDPISYSAYLQSRPPEWENKAIEMVIRLCRKHNSPVHIVHVSSSDALKMISEAKEEGLPLTAETCPHYILFHAGEIPDGATLFKCAPPIREKENNILLMQALQDAILDLLGSDHSPAPPELKEISSGSFLKAWGGIAGLQFLLSASWTALKGKMPVEKFIPLLTERPAALVGISDRKGSIREGFDADLVTWSPQSTEIVAEGSIFHRHKISPYVSRELSGVVSRTIVNGQLVYTDQKIINKNAGTWVLRK